LATCYQVGCIIGSLIFGVLAYIIGRKKIFIITLVIYAIGITISIVPGSIIFLAIGRFLTGISVGG
jgi:MFS family permease